MSTEHIGNTQKRKNSSGCDDNEEIPRFRTKCLRKKKEKRQLWNDSFEFFEKQKKGCDDANPQSHKLRVNEDHNSVSEDDTSDDDYDSIDFDLRRELNLATGDIDAIPRLFQPVFHNIENKYGPNFKVFFKNEEKLPKALCRYAEEYGDGVTGAIDYCIWRIQQKNTITRRIFQKIWRPTQIIKLWL